MDLDLEMELWKRLGGYEVAERAREPLVEKVRLMLVARRLALSEEQSRREEEREALQRDAENKRRAAEQFGRRSW